MYHRAWNFVKNPNSLYIMCVQSLVVPGGKLIRVKGRSGPKEAETPPKQLFSVIYGIVLAFKLYMEH